MLCEGGVGLGEGMASSICPKQHCYFYYRRLRVQRCLMKKFEGGSFVFGRRVTLQTFNKMLTNFTKRIISGQIFTPVRFAFGGEHHHHEIDYEAIVTKNQKSGYYMNPNEVARRIARIIAHFDGVKNVESMNLRTQWWELGLNDLDYVELTVLVENEFKIEFPDDVAEKFKDVNDMVEFVSRSFWAV